MFYLTEGDYVPLRHNYSPRILGNRSLAVVHVGCFRAKWICYNGGWIGSDYVFWSIAGKPKALNLFGQPWLIHLDEITPMQ
jgi:hypothetical protein